MNFKDRVEIRGMSRFPRVTPVGGDLVMGVAGGRPHSTTFVKLQCNLTNALIRGILSIALKFL